MKPIKRLLVALDLTDMDEMLLPYVANLCARLQEVEKVFFIHNIKYEFPEEVEHMLETLDKPLAQVVMEDLQEKVDEAFARIQTDTFIALEQNESTAHAIAESARIYETDLILVGKKINYLGTGIMPRKLLRLTEAPILFVPETAPRQISSLLVAIDFSASSLEALKYGIYLKERMGAPLHCQHVYHIPMRYFPYIPVENVSESMRKSAEKSYKRFLQSLKPKPAFDIPCTFTPGKNKSIAQNIYGHAIRQQQDLIIVGAKGHSMFVGSVVDGLNNLDMHVPMLVVQ